MKATMNNRISHSHSQIRWQQSCSRICREKLHNRIQIDREYFSENSFDTEFGD